MFLCSGGGKDCMYHVLFSCSGCKAFLAYNIKIS